MNQELTELLPALRRFAYSLTGSMSDADDLLQSTVERVLSRPLPADVNLSKWTFRICRNIWIDQYRAQKVRQQAASAPELSEGQVVDGERSIHKEIELKEVDKAMQQLPDEQRSILALVAIQGMAYKEVAATLEIPVGTVMSRLARARTRLVKLLQPSAPRTA